MPLPLAILPLAAVAAGAAKRVISGSNVDNDHDDNDSASESGGENNNNGINSDNNGQDGSKEKGGGEENEGEYTDDEHDSDSEYTYETVTDDEEDDFKNKRGGSWFGFLGGGSKKKQDEEMNKGGANSDDDDCEEEDIVAAFDNHQRNLQESMDNKDDGSTSSSEDEHAKHHLLKSPTQDITTKTKSSEKAEEEEEKETILMAQAIQRVQQRIQNNGGNLYDALSEGDRKLVDELKGIQDEEVIQQAVINSLEASLVDTDKKERKVATSSQEGENHHQNNLTIDTIATNKKVSEEETTPKVSEIIHAHVHNKATDDAAADGERLAKDHADESSDEDDEEDDEQPTLEEQRSLLSLAAEHDRVDVIQELLSNPSLHVVLLPGVSSSDSESNAAMVQFVPPPLHAAIAHGSMNAASCLLRMGADPSIRPVVPAPYLSGSYNVSNTPSRSGSSGSVNMEEDRNYKKYHNMTAWELAFGGITVLIEDDDNDKNEAEGVEEEEDEPPKRGWFGFGSGSTAAMKEDDEDEPVVTNVVIDGVTKKRRVKRKVPLNIPAAKLDGIKHAFTAEALRVIGSDEIDRLGQLVNAGMDGSMDVAGKTLIEWAVELDAKKCCELLKAEMKEDEETQEEDEGGDDNQATNCGNRADTASSSTKTPEKHQQQPAVATTTKNDRLAGLSLSDIQTLTTENLNLIPALTKCRDDLASEAHICQAILRDVASTGGKGGLSSQSLLELVRSLKEQRTAAEEAATAWQKAWEEREDELDFFWEEVLDDVVRNELGQILESVEPVDPSMEHLVNVDTAGNIEETGKRFIEVDNHVNALRKSISNFADENYMTEIEHHGLLGALNLTRSLRDEVKEVENRINLARMGEGLCRKKLEIIHRSIGGQHDEVDEASPGQQQNVNKNDEFKEGDDNRMSDYQLQAIVQQQVGIDGGHSSPQPVKQPSARPEITLKEDQYEELIVHRFEEKKVSSPVADKRSSTTTTKIHSNNEETVSSAHVEDERQQSNVEVSAVLSEVTSEGVAEEKETEVSLAAATQELKFLVDESMAANSASSHIPAVVVGSQQSPKPSAATSKGKNKPSELIVKGMSTAIVVHSTNSHTSSLSLQIWEILKRIVGYSRTPLTRSHSYHEVENNPHVMTV